MGRLASSTSTSTLSFPLRDKMVLVLVGCAIGFCLSLSLSAAKILLLSEPAARTNEVVSSSLPNENDLRYASTDGDGAAYWEFQGKHNVFGGQYKSGFLSSAMPCQARRILEFGSSGGEILAHVAPQRTDLQRFGVEISANARAHAHDKHPNSIVSVVERTDALMKQGLQFDFIYTTSVLEHCSSPLDEIIKLRQVLDKDRGILLALVVNEGEMADRDDFHENIHGHLYTWRALLLGNLLDAGGLQVCRCQEFHSAWPHVELERMMANRLEFCQEAERHGRKERHAHVVCAATVRNSTTLSSSSSSSSSSCRVAREALRRVATCNWADPQQAETQQCLDTSLYSST